MNPLLTALRKVPSSRLCEILSGRVFQSLCWVLRQLGTGPFSRRTPPHPRGGRGSSPARGWEPASSFFSSSEPPLPHRTLFDEVILPMVDGGGVPARSLFPASSLFIGGGCTPSPPGVVKKGPVGNNGDNQVQSIA